LWDVLWKNLRLAGYNKIKFHSSWLWSEKNPVVAQALEEVEQNPLNRDSLRALLDGLALFASPFERWW
jgi:hypothetical protein